MTFPMKLWEERGCLQRIHGPTSVGYNSTGHCAPCDANSASEFNNVTLTRYCTPCPQGMILSRKDKRCITCGIGELVSPDRSYCMRCEPGKYKSPDGRNPETGLMYRAGDRCTACDAGFYQDKEAQEECKPCWPGTFSEQPGSAFCTRCAPLNDHPFLDMTVLNNRDFRFFCRRTAETSALVSECNKCQYANSGAIKDAAICCDYSLARVHKVLSKELGKEVRYCSHGDPASAPPIFCTNVEKPPACPDTPTHRRKEETFYQPFGKATSCKKCPSGCLCEASCPESKSGNCTASEVVRTTFDSGVDYFVMRHQKALDMSRGQGLGPFRCITPGACVGRNKCRWEDESKHQGIMCGSCAPGYTTKSVYELCKPCPEVGMNILYAVLGVLFLSMYIGAFIHYALKAVHHPKAVESIVLKVFINYCQMTAVSFAVAKIGIEDYLSWYIDAASFLSQDPVGVLMSLDCLFDLRGDGQVVDYVYLWGALNVIPVVCVLTCLVYTICWAIMTARKRGFGKPTTKWHPKMYIPVICVAIFFTHPIATQYFLSVFDCGKNNPGTKYQYDVERFLTNLDVDCTSDEHVAMQSRAITGILVISFGFPVACWVLLYICRDKLQTETYLEAIGFLYNGFEPQVYYFEAVIMIRKVLFVICSIIPGLDDDGRVTVMLFVAIIFLAVNNTCEPWDDRAYNLLDRIEAASLRAIILLLLARLVQAVTDTSYRFREESVREKRDIVLQVLVLSQHFWVLCLIFWGLMRERVRPYLVRMGLAGSVETVDLDMAATLDATRISHADRNVLVMIYGDAVDFLLDSVKTVDLRDLGMIIRGAITIANADKADQAVREKFVASLDKKALKKQHMSISEEMDRTDIPGLVDRDSTTLPKEIMLGPVTVEELHMGFMYLINHLQGVNLDMTGLERFGQVQVDPDNMRILQGAEGDAVNTLLQATRCIVQVKGMKRIFSVNNDLALFNTDQESAEKKMARKWKEKMQRASLARAEAGSALPKALPDVPDPEKDQVLTVTECV